MLRAIHPGPECLHYPRDIPSPARPHNRPNRSPIGLRCFSNGTMVKTTRVRPAPGRNFRRRRFRSPRIRLHRRTRSLGDTGREKGAARSTLGRTRGETSSPMCTSRRVQPSRRGGHRRTQSRGTTTLVPLCRSSSPLLQAAAYSAQRANPDPPETRLDGWYATSRTLPHRVARKARSARSAAESQPGFGSRRAGASSEMAPGDSAQTLRTRSVQALTEMCKPQPSTSTRFVGGIAVEQLWRGWMGVFSLRPTHVVAGCGDSSACDDPSIARIGG